MPQTLLYSNPTVKNPYLPRFQDRNFKIPKRTSLGECYFDLKGNKNDGKRKEQKKKWKRMQRRSKNCKLSNGIKFFLVAFLS